VPEGFFEKADDALGIPLGQVAEDLNRFREFMENGGSQTGPWRGPIEPVETSNSTEQTTKERNALSVESTEQKALSHDLEMQPAAIITEAIASGMGESTAGVERGEMSLCTKGSTAQNP
jgi:hypothetical protein